MAIIKQCQLDSVLQKYRANILCLQTVRTLRASGHCSPLYSPGKLQGISKAKDLADPRVCFFSNDLEIQKSQFFVFFF